jgi:cellulose synthase/poly-beta-1,6-N-acetylglucosamine synthase-like glycosyltransferase
MNSIAIVFWSLLFLVFYSYLGYGIVLFLIIRIKRMLGKKKTAYHHIDYEPHVTLFVAAYNEKDYVDDKVKNGFSLDYPKEKIHQLWVTDGSDDGTPDLLKKYDGVEVHHKDERGGKIGAMNRGMQFVNTDIVIFSDGNTMLGKKAIREIVNLFKDPTIGCVSGEKRIAGNQSDVAASAGEGIYWKYESTLKKWDFELYSVVGAAGELFAIRKDLYREVERDTLLDDFIISLRIARDGYRIGYNPEAYAIESASQDVKEELKRKVRISAGGFQSIVRLKELLNPFKYGVLSFQFISHRVLRWAVAPFALPLIFVANLLLAMEQGAFTLSLYPILFQLQILFYLAAALGWFLENRKIRLKILFVPYYFLMMNYSVYLGLKRYIKGGQSVKWERAKRAK